MNSRETMYMAISTANLLAHGDLNVDDDVEKLSDMMLKIVTLKLKGPAMRR